MDRYTDPVNDYSNQVEEQDYNDEQFKAGVIALTSGEDFSVDDEVTIYYENIVDNAFTDLDGEDYADLIINVANGDKESQAKIKQLIRNEAERVLNMYF